MIAKMMMTGTKREAMASSQMGRSSHSETTGKRDLPASSVTSLNNSNITALLLLGLCTLLIMSRYTV